MNGIKCMAYLADNFYPWPTFANLLREMAAVLPVTALINPELAAESAKTLYSFALNFSEEPAAVEFANSMFKMQSRYYRQVAIAHRNTEFDAAFQHTPEPSLN